MEKVTRRKAVKTIVSGVTTIAAYHTLPSKWGTPIIEQIFLPAHAATSGAATYSLTANRIGSGLCGPGAISVNIQGEVIASDGRSVSGAQLNIHYENEDNGEFDDATAVVDSNNEYTDFTEFVAPDGSWASPSFIITVSFVDQSTYGSATASITGDCR